MFHFWIIWKMPLSEAGEGIIVAWNELNQWITDTAVMQCRGLYQSHGWSVWAQMTTVCVWFEIRMFQQHTLMAYTKADKSTGSVKFPQNMTSNYMYIIWTLTVLMSTSGHLVIWQNRRIAAAHGRESLYKFTVAAPSPGKLLLSMRELEACF